MGSGVSIDKKDAVQGRGSNASALSIYKRVVARKVVCLARFAGQGHGVWGVGPKL